MQALRGVRRARAPARRRVPRGLALRRAPRGVQLLMPLQARCPIASSQLGRTASLGYGEQACAWLAAHISGWDEATTERYVDAVFRQWAARSQRAWTLDLTVLGKAYQVRPRRPRARQLHAPPPHERQPDAAPPRGCAWKTLYGRDGRTRPAERADAPESEPEEVPEVPRQTRDTALPKPPPPPIDWVKIAQPGRVWGFIEGDDFTGQA